MYCHLYYKGVKELEIHCHRKNFLPTLIDMWTHETKTMGTYETCMFLSSHRRLPSIFFITDDDFIPDARTHTHPSSRSAGTQTPPRPPHLRTRADARPGSAFPLLICDATAAASLPPPRVGGTVSRRTPVTSHGDGDSDATWTAN